MQNVEDEHVLKRWIHNDRQRINQNFTSNTIHDKRKLEALSFEDAKVKFKKRNLYKGEVDGGCNMTCCAVIRFSRSILIGVTSNII